MLPPDRSIRKWLLRMSVSELAHGAEERCLLTAPSSAPSPSSFQVMTQTASHSSIAWPLLTLPRKRARLLAAAFIAAHQVELGIFRARSP